MEITKILISDSIDYFNAIIKRFNLKKINNELNNNTYFWNRKTAEWNEKVILLFTWVNKIEIYSNMDYIFENFIPNKIINIWFWNILNTVDLKDWDIIIPNTFIEKWDNWNVIFLDNVIWNNYDLEKFWLIMNWLCLSREEEYEEYKNHSDFMIDSWIDTYDNISYNILHYAEKKSILSNCLVIKWIKWNNQDNKKVIIENSLNILELVL